MIINRIRAGLGRLLGLDRNPAPALSSAPVTESAALAESVSYDLNRDQSSQVLLKLHFQQLVQQGQSLPSFRDIEFRAYSQNGEDGLLLFVFAVIGTTDRRCIELCAGNGIQCNSANLIINHGWQGLLVDGNAEKLAQGEAFYRQCQDTRTWVPKLVHSWVTLENVNDILRYHGFVGDIDLLSLDMDSNDYWIWQAIEVADPRVVILEYQSAWGPERRVTQRYLENFDFNEVEVEGTLPRCGASLAAFVSLAKAKGYRLVGCQALCFNAIFIKCGIAEEYFPEISSADCFDHPMQDYRRDFLAEHEHKLPDMWVEV